MAPPPTSEWGLDPLFWVNVKVAVCEIVGPDAVVTDAEGGHGAVRLYRGRPFRRCELMGHVVSLYARDTKTLFVLDDGTGTIECVVWIKSEGDNGGGVDGGVSVDDFGIDLNALRLGALVRAQGRITEYVGNKQITVRTLQACADANVEPLFWLDQGQCVREIEEDARRRADEGG